MVEVRITLTDEELLELEKVKGKKTWKQLLLATSELPAETILAREISSGFSLLKARVAGTMQDGMLIGLMERLRVICINLTKLPKDKRDMAIQAIEKGLDEWIQILGEALPKDK